MFNTTHGATLARGLTALFIITGAAEAGAAIVSLGTAGSYAVLAASEITNTGNTVLTGNVGVSGATVPSGFESVTLIGGTIEVGNGAAALAQADALIAYNNLAGLTTTETLTGQNLGTLTLGPGIYFFADTAQLTGALTLVGAGDYVFNISSSFTIGDNASMVLNAGALAADVFFRVGVSTTLGDGADIQGTIISHTANTLNAGATVAGSVIALNAAVTMISNTITVPEPSTSGLAVLGLGLMVFKRSRKAA
jgi:hypothetical protein